MTTLRRARWPLVLIVLTLLAAWLFALACIGVAVVLGVAP